MSNFIISTPLELVKDISSVLQNEKINIIYPDNHGMAFDSAMYELAIAAVGSKYFFPSLAIAFRAFLERNSSKDIEVTHPDGTSTRIKGYSEAATIKILSNSVKAIIVNDKSLINPAKNDSQEEKRH